MSGCEGNDDHQTPDGGAAERTQPLPEPRRPALAGEQEDLEAVKKFGERFIPAISKPD